MVVSGKISWPSLSDCVYFLTFIDDYTYYVWVYVLKTRSQVFEKFKEFKIFVEKLFGFLIKCIRTDNGGDYISSALEHFLRSEGVKHQKTVPKMQQQRE